MFPIVLVHGIARFDILTQLVRSWNIPWLRSFERFQYFKGIAVHLQKNGFENILSPNLDFAASSTQRAETLKKAVLDFLQQTGAAKVHIIAHSMGGLDSRRMILAPGMDAKVASLTTIGTPHLGTILADDKIKKGGSEIIEASKEFLNFDLNGNFDLTVEACEAFNSLNEDAEAKNGVHYQTYSSSEEADQIFGPLLLTFKHILRSNGNGGQPVPNDGLVPVASQEWKSRLHAADGTAKDINQHEFPFPADHLNQCGWWDLQERHGFFDPEDPLKAKSLYEAKVKAVYLEIAESVRNPQTRQRSGNDI